MWKLLNKEVDLGEPTSFLDHVYLGCTQRQCEVSKDIVDNYRTMFESRISAGGAGGITIPSKFYVFLLGHMTWWVMQRNVWNDIVSWQTGRLNNSTKCQLHALMTSISKKKNWNPWKICQKYALKIVLKCFKFWHELDDLIFYCQWINLHGRLQNGPKPVTNAWIDWFHIFIILVNTNNIVMWEILPNNADWDCFKTLTLQEILKIQNPLLEEHCACSEVIHLFQLVGCARNKLLFPTAQQNLKLSLWTLDWDWMVCLLWNYGI